MKAIVLVETEPGTSEQVVKEAVKDERVEVGYETLGPADVVLFVIAADQDDLACCIADKFQRIKGVRKAILNIVLHRHEPRGC